MLRGAVKAYSATLIGRTALPAPYRDR